MLNIAKLLSNNRRLQTDDRRSCRIPAIVEPQISDLSPLIRVLREIPEFGCPSVRSLLAYGDDGNQSSKGGSENVAKVYLRSFDC